MPGAHSLRSASLLRCLITLVAQAVGEVAAACEAGADPAVRPRAGEPDNSTTAMVLYSDNAEAVEWVNMCWRKARGPQLSGGVFCALKLRLFDRVSVFQRLCHA